LLVFYNLWVAFTLLLYYFGPIVWAGAQEPNVFLTVVVCMIFFNLGAKVVRQNADVRFLTGVPTFLVKDRRLSLAIMILFVVLAAISVQIATGKSLLSLETWVSANESVYNLYQQRIAEKVGKGSGEIAVAILQSLLFPIALVIFCASFQKNRLLAILFLFPLAGLSVARGTSKEVFDLAIICRHADLCQPNHCTI
jgi:hypothetical protein